ncbi:MAG: acyl carrier protein [Planctomycetota bacterium]|nr:acyl carrier protein [Planctomycetota bacterium]MDA1212961.1 acyl carrier protein [Planctomycetota bacterium]
MNQSTVENKLIDFLKLSTGQTTIDDSTDLLEAGLIDSLTMMDLIVFVESEFQTVIEFGDLTPETFRTPSTIAQLVMTRNTTLEKKVA